MFIQTEATPNPHTLKFIPGQQVMPAGTADFSDKEHARAASPLAHALLMMEEVERVFLAEEFISVTKRAEDGWDVVKPLVLTAVMDHFMSGAPVLHAGTAASPAHGEAANPEDAALVKQIIELIDTRVRPAVAQDGGDIVFRGYSEGIVKLELHGACSGCPSSSLTLKNGIENMLKYYVPEVQAVDAVR